MKETRKTTSKKMRVKCEICECYTSEPIHTELVNEPITICIGCECVL